VTDAPAPPRNSQPALGAIRAAGGDELLRGMLGAFSDFAAAQAAWLDRLADTRAYDGVAEGARVLRISAEQVGVLDVVAACEHAETAAAAHDAAAVRIALEEVHETLATARPGVDALAAGVSDA
jgi:HPt (histidine-containing phosphotransfer) domain-containing protein